MFKYCAKRPPREEVFSYIVWEISLSGDAFKDLAKLKHDYDLWNSIPILVTTDEMVERIRAWVEGSFHEIKDVLRVVSWKRIKKLRKKPTHTYKQNEERGIGQFHKFQLVTDNC